MEDCEDKSIGLGSYNKTVLSICCGAEEHPDVEGFCGACGESTGFEEEE